MLKQEAEVIQATGKEVKLKVISPQTCRHCQLNFFGFCGGERIISLESKINLKEGQKVQIGLKEKKADLLNVFVFLAPAVIFVLSLFVFLRGLGEALSFFLSLSFVFGYFFLLKIIFYKKKLFQPFILESYD